MKTRFLTIALMIIFTTGLQAETSHFKSEDSLYTSHMAMVTGSNLSETVDYNLYSEFLPAGVTLQNSASLEEWVESREAWESESAGMTENAGMEFVNLEGWFDSRESWERESSASDLASVAYTVSLLEEWVSNRETWEQEVSAGDIAENFKGAFQSEWINSRETWEQK